MKLTLMIEGSPAVIAAVLAALPGGATIVTEQQELPLHQSQHVETFAPDSFPTLHGATEPTDADDGQPDTGAPAVDSAGVPWDARIHASSKATVADGTWRMKRGVDKAVVDAVTAELNGQQPVAVETPPMPVMPEMPVAVEPMPMPVTEPTVAPMPTAEPVATPMPVAQPEPVPAAASPVTGAAITIPEFMQKLSAQMTGPDAKITNEYLAEVVGKFNAAYGTTFVTVNDFFTAPDKLPALVQMITLDGKW